MNEKQLASWAEFFLAGEKCTDRSYIVLQTGGRKTLGQPLFILGGLRIDL